MQTIIHTIPVTNLKKVDTTETLQVTTAPNPFRDNVQFDILSPDSGKLKIIIYDTNGIIQDELEQTIIKNMPAVLWYKNHKRRQGVLFYRALINKLSVTGEFVQIN